MGQTIKRKMKTQKATLVFNVFGYTLVTVFAILCLTPFLILISGSFTPESDIAKFGYSLFPKQISTAAYQLLFKNPADIVRAYSVSILVTLAGTICGLFITSMTGYILNRKDFKYRNQLAFFFYFTTLFSGGILSIYIFMVRYLHLKNSLLALILPLIMNVFYMLVMRTFISSIPDSISESAKIDGAGDFTIFVRLILPLSKAGLATIGLFYALDYWNDWYHAMLYITDYRKFPLQYMLYATLSSTEALARLSQLANVSMIEIPTRSLKLAMAVVVTGPIILVYPFVQKYFVKGITIGAVKG